MKKKNEEMMFLGVDGFNEIESIVPEKKQKKTAKTAKSIKNRPLNWIPRRACAK